MRQVGTILIVMFIAFTGYSQNWNTDFKKAEEIALKESKPIVLVFQGSDWCAPCIKLDREIWSSTAFKSYAKEHYVMVKADFPRRKKNALSKEQTETNAKLFETYDKNGIFPLVVVLDSNGKVLGETSYNKMAPENYIKKINMMIKGSQVL